VFPGVTLTFLMANFIVSINALKAWQLKRAPHKYPGSGFLVLLLTNHQAHANTSTGKMNKVFLPVITMASHSDH
jgi:hypothetical protein